jgi:hypothetical protein
MAGKGAFCFFFWVSHGYVAALFLRETLFFEQ